MKWFVLPKSNPAVLQAGTVLVFKPGLTQSQVAELLEKLRPFLEHQPHVNMFDPAWGTPVFYIP